MKKIEKEKQLKRNQEQEKIKLKERKGITLIALVITIIVLLILAGVSIAMLTGENGILSQAAKAKEETEKAQANEALILDEYNKFLNNAVGGTGSTTPPETGGEEVTAIDIAGDTSAIGKEVEGYECTNAAGVNKWLIFYADESNIYLIADDYISATYCPKGAKGSAISQNSTYKLSMDNVINDYEGAASITNSTIKALNNDYFTKYGSQNSTYNNMKATAYMLDTNVWSVYAGEKAEYAIGGPTIELFFKSYNKRYETNYVASATSKTGYKIGSGSASGYNLTLSKEKTLPYVVTSTSKANATWLASPSANDNTYVFGVACTRRCGQLPL